MSRTAGTIGALLVLAVVAASGCGHASGTTSSAMPLTGREIVITDSDLVRMSVQTAWEAVQIRAPRLTWVPGDRGQPTNVRIQTQRTLRSDETPLLVVNGVRVADIGFLTQIMAVEVRSIRILDSEAAQPLYGFGAGGGAIVVETRQPR